MKKYVSRTALIVSLAAAITTAVPAPAGVLISFEEVGADVVATVSGSITLPAPGPTQSEVLNNRVAPSAPYFTFGDGSISSAPIYNWQGNSFPAFGTQDFSGPGWTNPGTAAGIADNERFGFANTNITFASDFPSGSEIGGTVTWSNQDFTTLGLTVGTYSNGLALDPTQTFTVNVVPEPATAALGLVSLGCGAAFVARRARGTKRAPRGAVRRS